MAEAMRAFGVLGRLHGFAFDDRHAAIADEAVQRHGETYPADTQTACRNADAILLSHRPDRSIPGFDGEFEHAVSAVMFTVRGTAVTVYGALAEGFNRDAIHRALAAARHSSARVTAVGMSEAWGARVERAAHAVGGVDVDHRSVTDAVIQLSQDAADMDVVVADTTAAAVLGQLADGPRACAARALFSAKGDMVVGPAGHVPADIAGTNAVHPAPMLLALSLLMDEGLELHSAARTLRRALGTALREKLGTVDQFGVGIPGIATTTREFTDIVLGLLPGSRVDLEFGLGATA
jgi:isocitrate/isopropylmalate dehydrogenase